jgi:hypothetical protein
MRILAPIKTMEWNFALKFSVYTRSDLDSAHPPLRDRYLAIHSTVSACTYYQYQAGACARDF